MQLSWHQTSPHNGLSPSGQWVSGAIPQAAQGSTTFESGRCGLAGASTVGDAGPPGRSKGRYQRLVSRAGVRGPPHSAWGAPGYPRGQHGGPRGTDPLRVHLFPASTQQAAVRGHGRHRGAGTAQGGLTCVYIAGCSGPHVGAQVSGPLPRAGEAPKVLQGGRRVGSGDRVGGPA